MSRMTDEELLALCGCEVGSPTALIVIGIGRVIESAAYERAAQVCDEHGNFQVYNAGEKLVAQSCASAIRAMKEQP